SCSVSPGRPAAPPLFPYTTLFRSRQTVVARAMLDEAVGNAEMKERKRVVIRREHLANCAACTARDGVFLYGDDRSMGAREPQQQLLVERFHEAQVDERCIELRCNLFASVDHWADRDDRESAAALASQLCFTDRQRFHLLLDRNAWTLASRIANGRGHARSHGGKEHLSALVLVCGRHDDEVGDAAEIGKIVAALMRRPVAADEAGSIDRESDGQVL